MKKSTGISLIVVFAISVATIHAPAQSINVLLSRTTSGASIVTTENAPATIPYFSGKTYDAANTADSGTYWNSLICPTVTFNNTSGSEVTNIVEQNLSLVDSHNNASSVSISSITFSENNGKNDTIHQTGMTTGSNPGTDGLSANPTSLVGQSWFNNGTSEWMIFNLTGLTPGGAFNLFIYGAGQTNGYGGTFTVPTANQGVGYNAALGAYTTEPSTASIYRSVVDGSGDPAAEQGLTWVELPVVADSGGDLSFQVSKDNSSGIKGSINGFQLQPLSVPEPSALALAGLGLTGLVLRLRRR